MVGWAFPAPGQELPDPGSVESQEPTEAEAEAPVEEPPASSSSRGYVEPEEAVEQVIEAPTPDAVAPIVGVGSPTVRNADAWMGSERIAPVKPKATSRAVHGAVDAAAVDSASEHGNSESLVVPGAIVLATALLLLAGFWPRKEPRPTR